MNLDRQRLEEFVNENVLHKHKKRTRIVNYIALICGVLLVVMTALEMAKKYREKNATSETPDAVDQ